METGAACATSSLKLLADTPECDVTGRDTSRIFNSFQIHRKTQDISTHLAGRLWINTQSLFCERSYQPTILVLSFV